MFNSKFTSLATIQLSAFNEFMVNKSIESTWNLTLGGCMFCHDHLCGLHEHQREHNCFNQLAVEQICRELSETKPSKCKLHKLDLSVSRQFEKYAKLQQ